MGLGGCQSGRLIYNNDETRQPGSKGLASGQQEMNEEQRLAAKFEAAVYLYELTGDPSYKELIEAKYTSIVPSWGPTQWDTDKQEALLYYTRLPNISTQVKNGILKNFLEGISKNGTQLPMVLNSRTLTGHRLKTTHGPATGRRFDKRGYINLWNHTFRAVPPLNITR